MFFVCLLTGNGGLVFCLWRGHGLAALGGVLCAFSGLSALERWAGGCVWIMGVIFWYKIVGVYGEGCGVWFGYGSVWDGGGCQLFCRFMFRMQWCAVVCLCLADDNAY